MRLVIVACLCVLATGACGSAPQNAPSAYAVRDSAGIRVVTYPGAFPGTSTITFAKTPTYRYGEKDGEHTFQRIWAGAFQPDGGAVVVDWGTQEAVVLSPTGALRSVLVHRGQGPGEAERIMSVQVLGQDTILFEDDGNARFMLFEDGKLARSVGVQDKRSLSLGLMTMGTDSLGRLLMWTSSYRPGFKEAWLPGKMVRFDLGTGTADTVGSYDMARRMPPGGPINAFGYSGVTTASGGHFVYGRSDVAQLLWLTSGGTPVQVLRWAPPPTYPGDKDLDAMRSFMRTDLARMNPRLPKSRLDDLIKQQTALFEIVPGKPWPFFTTLMGDGEGGVWMGEKYIRGDPDGPHRFDVIAPDGTFVGTAVLPDRFHLLAVRGHLALGVLKDDMDVQSVAVFPFTVVRGEAK